MAGFCSGITNGFAAAVAACLRFRIVRGRQRRAARCCGWLATLLRLDRVQLVLVAKTRCLVRLGAVNRHWRAADRGAAAKLRADAEVNPGALAVLPPAFAGIEHRERWDTETLGERL